MAQPRKGLVRAARRLPRGLSCCPTASRLPSYARHRRWWHRCVVAPLSCPQVRLPGRRRKQACLASCNSLGDCGGRSLLAVRLAHLDLYRRRAAAGRATTRLDHAPPEQILAALPKLRCPYYSAKVLDESSKLEHVGRPVHTVKRLGE